MHLIDRYLAAIAKHLPAARRQDILAELSANLHAEIEDREAELNRSLTDEELAAILRQHGHPLQVALRYQPQRSLIGPALFPYYVYFLQRALPLVLFVLFVTRGALLILDSSTHNLAGRLITGVPYTLFLFWAVSTLCFAAAEWTFSQHKLRIAPFETWDPLKLREPQPPSAVKIGPKYPVVDLIFDALFTAWMATIPSFPTILFFGPVAHWAPIEAAPVWHRLYVPIVTLLVARLVIKGIAVDSRHSPVRTGLLYAAADALSLTVLALLVHSGEALFLFPGEMPSRIQGSVHFSIMVGLRVGLTFAAVGLFWKLWQILRMRGTPNGATAAMF